MYHALAQAHESARQTADPKVYEEHLWNALTEILQRPLEHGNDTLIVVDGLDEVQGGHSAGQALLERLTRTVGRAKRTKIIGFSQSLQLPSGARGTQRNIAPEDTRDDLHAVAIRLLARCHHFTSKPGQEQDTILSKIIDAAKGSFLWTILVSENLKAQKTPQDFAKILPTLKSSQQPSMPDLVTSLQSLLQPSSDATLLLSWIVGAARPLTYDELDCLFAIDVENTMKSDRRVDVHSLVQTIRPLVSVSRDVVRVRHETVRSTLQSLYTQGKAPTPTKDRQMDILLRTLTYAKVTLHDKGEPTLDNTNQSLPAKLFPRHHLLEYVIRYWPYHLRQTQLLPAGSSEPKPTPELQRAFPDSTSMPVLEWLCWVSKPKGIPHN